MLKKAECANLDASWEEACDAHPKYEDSERALARQKLIEAGHVFPALTDA